jgi:hypothetical protein
MDELETGTNYSADVDLWLDRSGERVRLAQVSSSFVISDPGAEAPAGPATIVLSVDGRTYERRVRLLSDLTSASHCSLVEPDDDIPI